MKKVLFCVLAFLSVLNLWSQETTYDKLNIQDGVCLISSSDDLLNFALAVNEGNNTLGAELTTDVDITNVDFPMIGTSTIQYSGTFDGQNHTITLNQTASQSYYGLFCILNNATIKNLRTAGEIRTAFNIVGGICGQMLMSTLQNCVSSVNIISSVVGDGATGGIAGWTYQGMVKNCVFNGSISGEFVYNCGGFAGWCSGQTYITDCLQIAEINIAADQGDTWNITRNPGANVCTNVYYLNPVANANEGTIQITKEQLESGELCYLLNGDQTNILWTQAVGDAKSLLPFPGKQVFKCGSEFVNVGTEEEFAYFKEHTDDYETKYCENIGIANENIVEQYQAVVEQLSECEVLDEYIALYNSLTPIRLQLQKSKSAYMDYQTKVNEAKAYLDNNEGMSGTAFDILNTYLTAYKEPNDTYPFGTSEYILEVSELNEEELKEEIGRLEEMLYQVTYANYLPGSDVTRLLVNSDFSDGFNGWNGQLATSFGSSETSEIKAVVCEGQTIEMYQTITGVKNGIYELSINGAFRPYPQSDKNSTNYAAILYANDNQNYFQTNIEGMIPVADAVDGVNCHITGSSPDEAIEDLEGNVIGYVLSGIESCSNAFQAGRYENAILVNVTDGTLTIGIKQQGTGNQPEWIGFGNIKLTYCGSYEEADENLNHVLVSQVARANTILNNYEFSTGEDYSSYPNFSQEIKDELRDALELAQTVSDPNNKYTLIEFFSELFKNVYDSKRDYVKLMSQYMKVESVYSIMTNYLDENDRNEMDTLLEKLSSGYADGSLNKEDCEKNYLATLPFMPKRQEDGKVYLNNAKDLISFAIYTNNIDPTCDAVLTADIDLTNVDFPMIGTSSIYYSGTFDGQYHTVTLNQKATQSYYGLFCILNNATIKNLRTAGEIYSEYNIVGGICGQMCSSTIQNCVSSVNIVCALSGDAATGGIAGWTYLGNIKDCVFNGSITGGYAGNCGGFVGWCSGQTYITNCLQIAEINIAADQGDTWNITRNPGANVCTNVYYLNPVANTNEGTVQITKEQLEGGEVCFLLNGDQSDIQWTQTIGEDYSPLPFPSREIVYKSSEGTYNNGGNGLLEVGHDTNSKPHGIFNLMGQKVEKTQKGIYIINGQKVIKK